MNIRKYFGPSTLVTAAFIGPGTLTLCTLAGASFGFSLLWVLLFAIFSTIVLQEMTARLGLITQSGLGEAIRNQLESPVMKAFSAGLVFIAVVIGNAAYEAGNISGASLGLSGIFPLANMWPLFIGLAAFTILLTGKFKLIEQILIALVIVMSVVFVATAVFAGPSLALLIEGLFVPSINDTNQWTIIALIGTTVVPYNLFLHASSVSQKWRHTAELRSLRQENGVAIGIGGIISMAIVITSAATIYGKEVNGINEMALQLEPLLGSWSKYFLATGLFAAGLSSSITAPLAAAYAAKGIFGWDGDLKSMNFRLVWSGILAIGTFFSLFGYQPIEVIKVAQIANGILLPVIVAFLIWISNKRQLLGDYVNSYLQNFLGGLVFLIAILISLRSLNNVFQVL
jgi:Mn2+/Fe2+ NRAMP family transporter